LVLAVGALASTTCDNFIADLLFSVFERSAAPPPLAPSRWGSLRAPLFWEIGPGLLIMAVHCHHWR
jgi:hypothetical protein